MENVTTSPAAVPEIGTENLTLGRNLKIGMFHVG